MAAESPRNNGLVKCHKVVLGLIVSLTVEEANCDLNVTVVSAVSAKMLMVSPLFNLYLEKKTVLNVFDDFKPALENKIPAKQSLKI